MHYLLGYLCGCLTLALGSDHDFKVHGIEPGVGLCTGNLLYLSQNKCFKMHCLLMLIDTKIVSTNLY